MSRQPLRLKTFALAVASVLLLACESTSGAARQPELARFRVESAAALELPDTVQANVPFTLSVRIITGNCQQTGATDVANAGQVAVVTLYTDRRCTDEDIGIFRTRTVTLAFSSAGTAAVRVTGRGHIGPQTFERTVVVR